jgi:hypothetical protein
VSLVKGFFATKGMSETTAGATTAMRWERDEGFNFLRKVFTRHHHYG